MTNRIDEFINKYTSSRPVVIEGEPEAQTVHLDVNQQHFTIATAEDGVHAMWYRKMLAKALITINQDLLTHVDKLEAIRDECDSFALDVLYSAGEMIETKRIRNKAEQIQQRIKDTQ